MTPADIIKKYRLDQRTWTPKTFHGILHFFFPVGEQPLKPLRRYFGDSYTLTIFFFEGTLCRWFWNNEDMVRLRTSFVERVRRHPSTLRQLERDWHRRLRTFDRVMLEVDATNLRSLTDAELLALYRRWYRRYLDEYGISIGIQDAFSMQSDSFLAPHFREIIRQDFDASYALLTSPVTESFITQEYRSRLRLLRLFRRRDTAFRRQLERHARTYHWIMNNYAKDVCLTPAYFEQQLRGMRRIDPARELRQLDHQRRTTREQKQRLMRRLRLDRDSRSLIRITEVFAAMQDERKKYVLLASHYQRRFLDETARRLGLSRRQADFTFIHELPQLFARRRIPTAVFKRRRQCVLVIQTLRGYEIVEGRAAREVLRQVFERGHGDVRELKGSIASSGVAKGSVKVIQKIHDLANMEEGDILVASMTRPEMVSAMKKAAAIVTDEGGITSHAAIVSRELGIPCIIGTKIATRVFKDGDQVEVDAVKGIVRRI